MNGRQRNALENLILILFAIIALPFYILYLLVKNAK